MIPADHILFRIDGLIDLGELRDALAPHYSRRGRPSIAPELLVRMARIARLYGITSERRLCEEVRFNLAYRWFCRLPLDARVLHHSTFSKNRHGRFRDAGIFRILFEQTVRRCADAGLIAHEDAAIDASFVAADACWQRKMRDADIAAPRLPRPVCEWLADEANAPPQEHGVPRGKPAAVSRTDPASAWSARTARGRFGYALNVLIDTPGGVTIDVEASPARFAAEVDAGRTMLARADDRFGYRPKRVAADTAYGSVAFLAFVTDRGTIPHIPVLERSEQTKGKFPREAFRYEREQDRYVCPAGKILPFAVPIVGRAFSDTAPAPPIAAPVTSNGNVPQAATGRSRTANMRTCASWCAARCRRPYSSGRCGCVGASSGFLPMRRVSGG